MVKLPPFSTLNPGPNLVELEICTSSPTLRFPFFVTVTWAYSCVVIVAAARMMTALPIRTLMFLKLFCLGSSCL